MHIINQRKPCQIKSTPPSFSSPCISSTNGNHVKSNQPRHHFLPHAYHQPTETMSNQINPAIIPTKGIHRSHQPSQRTNQTQNSIYTIPERRDGENRGARTKIAMM